MPGAEASIESWQSALEPLRVAPKSAAVLSDLDGTLAPIVARPELVFVPERIRGSLARIAARYALCAIVTGRRPEVAREIVGLGEIAYAGNHGLELLAAGAAQATPSPALAGRFDEAATFLAASPEANGLGRAGVRVEDKGPIVALHWRGAASESEAEGAVARVGAAARSQGLVTHAGRKVLELRPAVPVDKGVAIEALLAGLAIRTALFAGDDRTDVDGFRALGRMRDAGRLEHVVRVGVRSPEAPAELIESSDLTVDGTEALADLLEVLAG